MPWLWRNRRFLIALTALLVAGCSGGGDPGAKVEAGVLDYISAKGPANSFLPVGAGPPRVMKNSCRNRHVKTKKGEEVLSRTQAKIFPNPVTLWSCVITFRNIALPTLVAVNEKNAVVWLATGKFDQFQVK